ncbi:PP2C family protein-serine/threonine phosphatase [Streptomyces sp. NPDC021212]|uniref:PP2C family protein-serine/threonine phosphatase n=1 Tax=Streptomyces sp. NPDC021212 TaxID=3365118 RepID=UPI00379D8424
MTTRTIGCDTADGLSRAVRRIARDHSLDPGSRGRLVLSVATVAAPALGASGHTSLSWTFQCDDDDRPGLLTLALGLDGSAALPSAEAAAALPLPADAVTGREVVWRLPAAPAADLPATDPADDAALVEEELRAVVARTDALSAEHRRLKDELAETNSGVLALYVQLDERDAQLRKAHGQTLRELEDALRPSPLEVEGLELAVHYEPAGTDAPTGGDLYDWFTLPDGTVHITVVDALGHGVTSTRGALNVTHAVRTLALEGHHLQSIVARTDEILLPFDRSVMATVLLARINPATGELWVANGSHPPALLTRADGTARYLEARGRGIGFPMPGSDRLLTAKMAPGDLLLLYTDGLTESRRDPVEGEKRLIEAVYEHLHAPIEEIPGAIADDMHTVILHPDDTLALAVRVRA